MGEVPIAIGETVKATCKFAEVFTEKLVVL